jgi:membrane-associated phospholipid phosphatase
MVKQLSSILLLGFLLSTVNPARANDRIEMSGNILEFVLPAAAAGITAYMKDWTGTLQLGESIVLNEGITGILKYTVKERRPNGEDDHSFPSGHMSLSCTSAEFMRKRFGWIYGTPMYALAAFVGYSRIESKHHYLHDVAAGAVIGIASGYIFTRPYHGIEISGSALAGHFAIRCSGSF